MSCVLHFIKSALHTKISNGFKVIGVVFAEAVTRDITAIEEVPQNVGVEENIVEKGGISCLQPPKDEAFGIIIICCVLFLHIIITFYGD